MSEFIHNSEDGEEMQRRVHEEYMSRQPGAIPDKHKEERELLLRDLKEQVSTFNVQSMLDTLDNQYLLAPASIATLFAQNAETAQDPIEYYSWAYALYKYATRNERYVHDDEQEEKVQRIWEDARYRVKQHGYGGNILDRQLSTEGSWETNNYVSHISDDDMELLYESPEFDVIGELLYGDFDATNVTQARDLIEQVAEPAIKVLLSKAVDDILHDIVNDIVQQDATKVSEAASIVNEFVTPERIEQMVNSIDSQIWNYGNGCADGEHENKNDLTARKYFMKNASTETRAKEMIWKLITRQV